MEFVINELPKIKIRLGEQVYEMSQPTMAVQKRLQESLEESQATGKSPFPVLIKWAVELGLPEEFVLSLPQKTFQDLVEFVSDASKKK